MRKNDAENNNIEMKHSIHPNSSLSLQNENKTSEVQENNDNQFEIGELDNFLLNCVNHPKDKFLLLKLEVDLISFIKDKNKNSILFPKMNPYQRLIIHRVAHYFGLTHLTSDGKITLYKNIHTKVPLIKFSDLIILEDQPNNININSHKQETEFKIMKRPTNGKMDEQSFVSQSHNSTIENQIQNSEPKVIMKRSTDKEESQKTACQLNFSEKENCIKNIQPKMIMKRVEPPKPNSEINMKDKKIGKEEFVDSKKNLTMEERELAYEKARERIFKENQLAKNETNQSNQSQKNIKNKEGFDYYVDDDHTTYSRFNNNSQNPYYPSNNFQGFSVVNGINTIHQNYAPILNPPIYYTPQQEEKNVAQTNLSFNENDFPTLGTLFSSSKNQPTITPNFNSSVWSSKPGTSNSNNPDSWSYPYTGDFNNYSFPQVNQNFQPAMHSNFNSQRELYDPKSKTSSKPKKSNDLLSNSMKAISLNTDTSKSLVLDYSGLGTYDGVKASDKPSLPNHILEITFNSEKIFNTLDSFSVFETKNYFKLIGKYSKAKIKFDKSKKLNKLLIIFPNIQLTKDYYETFLSDTIFKDFEIKYWSL